MAKKIGLSDPLSNPKDAKVDIVFLHGLGGDRESTWTYVDKTTNTFWPKDLLPEDCPEARIMTFGYSSDWVRFFGLVGPERISQTTIMNHSTALLSDLVGFREKTKTPVDRPIIFVCHSLGGLICAYALSDPHRGNEAAQNIVKATWGTMFFGTPFQGSDLAKWGVIAEKFLKAFTNTNNSNLKALQPVSETLVMINNNFAKFLFARAESSVDHTVEVLCFFESLSLQIKGIKTRIVPQESAVLVGRDPVDIEADHISMCKFKDNERRGYIRASDTLRSWIKKFNEKLPKQEANKYGVYQGNVSYNAAVTNTGGIVAGNVYTPAENGIVFSPSTNTYNYAGPH